MSGHLGRCPGCDSRVWVDTLMTKLEADAQALADVRTLDEWAAADDERYVVTGPQYFGKSWYCTLWHVENKREAGPFQADTPDAARHAAAEWVRSQ